MNGYLMLVLSMLPDVLVMDVLIGNYDDATRKSSDLQILFHFCSSVS